MDVITMADELLAQRTSPRGDYFVSEIGQAAESHSLVHQSMVIQQDARTDKDVRNRPTVATGYHESDDSSVQVDGHPDFVLIGSDYVPS